MRVLWKGSLEIEHVVPAILVVVVVVVFRREILQRVIELPPKRDHDVTE